MSYSTTFGQYAVEQLHSVLREKYKVVTVFIVNTLDQDVTIQIIGNWEKAKDGVAIGASFTVSAGKKDFRTLTPDTSGWCPYLYCSAVCTVAPTTGSLTVLRIRSKENITKMFDAYEIRDTLKHLSEVVEW